MVEVKVEKREEEYECVTVVVEEGSMVSEKAAGCVRVQKGY